LIQFTPILQALAKVEDVRPHLAKIVRDDRVLFGKAAALLRGGKFTTERIRSETRYETN